MPCLHVSLHAEPPAPLPPHRALHCRIETKLRSLSNAKAYNVLHLRAESDWITHCKRWENIPDGAQPAKKGQNLTSSPNVGHPSSTRGAPPPCWRTPGP